MSQRCAGVVRLTASSAPTVISDGPGNYGPFASCVWIFSARDSPIKVQFSSFATESGYDFVKIYDGPSTSSPLLQSLGGYVTSPSAVTSSGGSMTIAFTSDSSAEAAGFVATVFTGEQAAGPQQQPLVHRGRADMSPQLLLHRVDLQ